MTPRGRTRRGRTISSTLKAIAANPLQFASDGDVRKFVSGLIAGLADALSDQALIARAKADLKARTDVTPYVCPMPADVKPPLQPRK